MDASAILPPVGLIGRDDHSLVTNHLSNLVKESTGAAEQWIAAAESNLRIYTNGTDSDVVSTDVQSNQIQDACNAVTDFQTKDPSIRNLTPIERGEPSQVYYFTPPINGQSQINGPFTEDDMQAMLQPQLGVDGMGQAVQQPSQFNPKNFVMVNDKTTADFFQKPLDVYWNRGNLDKGIRMGVHYSNIFGFLFPIYEFDMDYHRPRLWTDISLKDTYIDPTRASLEDAAFAGVDWWIDAEQAKTMFPHLADIIEERARTGTPERPSGDTQLGFNVDNANQTGGFRRNTIILRVFWLRNQPCPYEEEEALATGLLERVMVPIGDPSAIIEDEEGQFPRGDDDGQADSGATGDASAGDGGDNAPGAGSDQAGQPIAANLPSGPDGAGVEGGGIPEAQPVQPAMRSSIQRGGIEVADKADPNWPMYRCTRQITAVLGLVVDDRECEYWDIPMLQFISTPIPYQPFGQGLPARLVNMQDGRTDMLTAIRDHCIHQAHGTRVIPESVWQTLPSEYQKAGNSLANITVRLPNDQWNLVGGKPNFFMTPPPMSQAIVDGEKIFHDELTERSGNPDILSQGKPPAGVTGWQSIQMLTQNASSRFGFSQQWTKDVIKRTCMLLMHDLINPKKVTVKDLHAIDSRYPLAIVDIFQKRAMMMDWDMDIDLPTGSSSSRNRKQAEAIEAHNMTDPVTKEPVLSTESLRDALGLDNEQEAERNAKQAAIAQQMQAQQMAQEAAMNPSPDKPGQNGNGHASRISFGGPNSD